MGDFPQITPKENIMMAYRHEKPAYIPSMFTDIAMFQANPTMERYCGLETGRDGFNVEWKFERRANAPMTTQDHQITSITDWEKIKFPDLDAIDWEKQADIDAHTNISALVGGKGLVPFDDGHSVFDEDDKFKMCMVINGPFERMHALEGFDNALCDLLTEPEACADYFAAISDWKCRYFHKIATYYKVDGINGHDDYGSAHNLFMSLDTWRKLIKPNLAKMVEQVHKDGLIYQHHSCGYVEPLFDDLIEIGVDALDTLQGGSNPNLGELKKRYGDKITFCGGFDNQYVLEQPDVTPEQIKAEYRRVIDLLAPGGSYVVFPISLGGAWMMHFAQEHFQYGMSYYATHPEA
ncbi:MAG: hypothetical protein IKZ95_04820 [Lachnospiraceae bacterium]|nr:hypothetical protein [Lachnospiraceae bacterium]